MVKQTQHDVNIQPMKTRILFGAMALIASSVLAADSGAKDEIKAAAKKLGDNYSWKTTIENAGGGGGGGRGLGGPAEGKTAGGTTWLSLARRDTTTDAYMTGMDKGAIKTDEGWRSLSELTQDAGGGGGGFNPTAWLARTVRNYKAPATQAAELAEQTKALTKEGDAYSGELTEEGAKALLSFRGGGGQGPTVQNAKGTVKYWVADGKITKYQYNVKGTISFNDNDREVDRTITTEIKEVGTTKVEVPADAKAKMS